MNLAETVRTSLAILCSIGLLLGASTSHATLTWEQLARHVGHSENTRTAALRELRKFKNLNQTLMSALTSNKRALALDVISAMKIDALVPELLERVSADEDGFLVLTLNSLLSEENRSFILGSYVSLIGSGANTGATPAALVAVLEPLGRLGIVLPRNSVANLMEHSFPEVRIAALHYARQMATVHRRHDYSSLAMRALRSQPFQLRLKAIYMIEELKERPEARIHFDVLGLVNACEKERAPAVKSRCQDVIKKWRPQ